ncbi:MAG TPA: ethanolamine permease [Bacteriovoracaceae bacterium]|nr:ethanolamine permease [Bacteriovoracaceae bacterium]
MQAFSADQKLERTLGPVMLWGLGVGYVISGMYFGWNLGLPKGGTLGLGISTLFITLMYVLFTFSYCELACAIPRAGGAFDYANRALGVNWGFLAGFTQFIEFVFAPPAIAYAIGAYFHEFFPSIPILPIAMAAFLVFTSLNIFGVKAAASFELFITIFAVLELLIFAGIALPHFQIDNITRNALPHGVSGIFASIPFAIWFFLGIEGVANVSEETINPQVNVYRGFGSAIITLVILCFLTFFSSIGVAGWEAVVYPNVGSLETSDGPLPLALSHIVGKDSLLYHLLITIGLFGLIASFHGIILAAGRITFEFGRVGYFPRMLGKTHNKFRTPMWALICNMLIGILALLTGKTGEIITIACFGALGLYIFALVTFFRLRITRPDMERPFKAPFYPLAQGTALLIAVIALMAMTIFNPWLALIYFGMMAIGFILFKLTVNEDKKTRVLD